MSDYKIDRGIPIPPLRDKRPRRDKYGTTKEVLSQMEVGDSFFVGGTAATDVLDKFYNPANRMGIRITARRVDGGVRVWRIK